VSTVPSSKIRNTVLFTDVDVAWPDDTLQHPSVTIVPSPEGDRLLSIPASFREVAVHTCCPGFACAGVAGSPIVCIK
jgi:hypothetical protein